jgi:putative aldouronate transport system substrate-binding protein
MRKVFVCFLILLITALTSGCMDFQSEPASKENAKEVKVNKTGFPIVDEKITLQAVALSHDGIDWNDLEYFKKLEELTNIHIEFTNYGSTQKEKINLMFASGELPDLIFGGPTDEHIIQAAEGKAIAPLNEMIEEYAPNWKKAMDEYPYIRKVSTLNDGKIYSLPFVNMSDVESGLRDQWLINKDWLDEVGLEKPRTTDEFYEVLKAFKENAGKGSIPKNVIPWYFRFNQTVGGQTDIYGSFGVFSPWSDYIAVENGKVKFQAMNPEIKEPLKFLHKLYKEGLIPSAVFTDDWNTYIAKVNSDPPVAGVFGAFYNTLSDVYEPMSPIKAPTVEKPLFRRQLPVVIRNHFTITNNNPYKEASMRLADVLADPDWSLQGNYGLYGKSLEKMDDGKVKMKPDWDESQLHKDVPSNIASLLITPEVNDRLIVSGPRKERGAAIDKYYKEYTVSPDRLYPPTLYTPEEKQTITSLETDILSYINQTMAKWITEGGIDKEWDAYTQKLEDMNVDEMVEIRQDALNRFNQK